MLSFKEKYLKYKEKYIRLQEKLNGGASFITSDLNENKTPALSWAETNGHGNKNNNKLANIQKGDNVLLIIDPQVDFHEEGSLAVPGANADSTRIAQYINKLGSEIHHIIISFDTHNHEHIAHSKTWENKPKVNETYMVPYTYNPTPFTLISYDNIKEEKWIPSAKAIENGITKEWALDYTYNLEKQGKYKLIIWPEHCIINSNSGETDGHKLTPILQKAIDNWKTNCSKKVINLYKGMNNRTEMYSIIKAEVLDPNDSLETDRNMHLLEALERASNVYICGQAKSHCVKASTEDILDYFIEEGKPISSVTLFEDGMSAVGGYEVQATEFINDLKGKGVKVEKIQDILS